MGSTAGSMAGRTEAAGGLCPLHAFITAPSGCAEGTTKFVCAGCNTCHYCSEECRAKHKEELHPPAVCAAFRSIQSTVPQQEQQKTEEDGERGGDDVAELRDAARFLSICTALKAGAAQPYAAADRAASARDGPHAFALLLSLCSGWEGTDEMDALQRQQAAGFYIANYESGALSAAEAAGMLEREAQNALGMVMPRVEGQPRELRGTCIYSLLAMANHACYPNAARQDYLDDPNGTGRLPPEAPRCCTLYRALQPVPKGEEVCISYAPLEYRVSDRRAHLYSTYGIACACARCRLEEKWDEERGGGDEEEEEYEEYEEEEEEESTEDGTGPQEGDGTAGEQPQKEEGDSVPPEALYHVFMTRFLCPHAGCGGTLVPYRNAELCAPAGVGTTGAVVAETGGGPTICQPARAWSGCRSQPTGRYECNTCYGERTEADFEAAMVADAADNEEEEVAPVTKDPPVRHTDPTTTTSRLRVAVSAAK